jgi:hypothetical protein
VGVGACRPWTSAHLLSTRRRRGEGVGTCRLRRAAGKELRSPCLSAGPQPPRRRDSDFGLPVTHGPVLGGARRAEPGEAALRRRRRWTPRSRPVLWFGCRLGSFLDRRPSWREKPDEIPDGGTDSRVLGERRGWSGNTWWAWLLIQESLGAIYEMEISCSRWVCNVGEGCRNRLILGIFLLFSRFYTPQ